MIKAGQPSGRPSSKPVNGGIRDEKYTQGRSPMGYATSRQLANIQHKYQCIVTGEKRYEPCAGCTNQKGCLMKTIQHKEP